MKDFKRRLMLGCQQHRPVERYLRMLGEVCCHQNLFHFLNDTSHHGESQQHC